jgi:hypothetical protein
MPAALKLVLILCHGPMLEDCQRLAGYVAVGHAEIPAETGW